MSLLPSAWLRSFPDVARVADAVWTLAGRGYLGCRIRVTSGSPEGRLVSGSGITAYRIGCGQIIHANVLGYAYKEDEELGEEVDRTLGALGRAVGSDVDHFFTAAALVCESVDEEEGRRRALRLCMAWDLLLSPLQKVIRGAGWKRAFDYDRRQFQVDKCGIAFGVAFARDKPRRLTRWQVLPSCAVPPPP